MSLSRKLLLRSSVAIVLFYGEGKSDAFKKFNQEGNYEECPARLVKKIKRSYAFTDII